MHLVKFAGTLTKEQQRAAKELAKAEKGWYDREQGGFMMRSEESAKQLADTILNNDDAVSDAQPVSLADTRKVIETEKPQQNQSASSQENGQDLTTGFTTDIDAVSSTKVIINSFAAKHELNNIVHKYAGQRKTRGFISDLASALGDKEIKQTYYFEFKDKAGNLYTLRISNHNVNAKNAEDNEKEISIVIKSRRQPNKFVPGNADVKEYVYFKESIANGNGQTLAWIAQDIATMLDTGVYADNSGIAVVNDNSTERSTTQPANPSGNRLITDERYAELRERMRKKLGGQMNIITTSCSRIGYSAIIAA